MRMLTKLFLSVSTVIMAVFMSCDVRHSYPRSLLIADSLSECNADSAMTFLDNLRDSIHTMSLEDSMYYALLRIKASDKAYLPHDTTDGILDIVDYYKHGGDRRLLPTAYYYAASAYRDMNKPSTALGYFYKTIAAAEAMGDVKVAALAYSQAGTLLYKHRMYEKAMEAYAKSLHCDSLLGNERGMVFHYRDLGDCYMLTGNSDSALYFFDKGLRLAVDMSNERLEAMVCAQLARLYEYMGNHAAAEKYIATAMAYDDSLERSPVLSIASRIYRATGREAKAVECDARLTRIGNIYGRQAAHGNLATYYSEIGQMDSATIHFNMYEELTDSITRVKAVESLANVQFQGESMKLGENRGAMGVVGWVVVCLVVAGLLAFLFFKTNVFRKGKSGTQAVGTGQDHGGAAGGEDGAVALGTAAERQQLLLSAPAVQRVLCMVNDKTDDPTGQKHKLTAEDWAELDSAVNSVYAGFKQKLLSRGRLSEFEYRVCLLIKVGVQPANIARLTFKETSTISNVRRRLYQKFFGEDGKGEAWDSFIHTL